MRSTSCCQEELDTYQTTSIIRIVYDGSFYQSKNQLSLSHCLLTGDSQHSSMIVGALFSDSDVILLEFALTYRRLAFTSDFIRMTGVAPHFYG